MKIKGVWRPQIVFQGLLIFGHGNGSHQVSNVSAFLSLLQRLTTGFYGQVCSFGLCTSDILPWDFFFLSLLLLGVAGRKQGMNKGRRGRQDKRGPVQEQIRHEL